MSRLLYIIGMIVLCLSSTSRSASAFCRSTTCIKGCTFDSNTTCPVEGKPIAWAGSCLSYSIHRDGSASISHAELSQVTDAAFRAWREATCPLINRPPSISVGDVFGVATCGRIEYNSRQANANVVVMRESWGGESNVLALTTVSINKETGEILDVDMEINGTQPLSVGPLVPTRFDLQSIITHEAGHFLGLAHSNKGLADNCRNGATMCPTYQPAVDDFRTLDDDDIAGICSVYPPARTAPACDPTPRRGFSPECGLDPITGGGCSQSTGRSSPGGISALVLGFGIAMGRLHRRGRRAQKVA